MIAQWLPLSYRGRERERQTDGQTNRVLIVFKFYFSVVALRYLFPKLEMCPKDTDAPTW